MSVLLKKMLIVLALFTLSAVSGCDDKSVPAMQKEADNELTTEQPLRVNVQQRIVAMLVKVNGRFFTEDTRHAVVYQGGANHGKALFIAYVTPQALYDALLQIKAVPGNNMTFANATTTHVGGSKLIASVYWQAAGHPYLLDDVIRDSNGKRIDLHFGGNLQAAQDKGTGCLICLDSCPVGIISNASYTYGAVEKRGEVTFRGNAGVLPPDGTLIRLTLAVAD